MKKRVASIQIAYRKYPLVFQILIGLLFLSPILLASCYTHPWWDDYIYTTPGHLQFTQDHSLIGVIQNAANIAYDKYMNTSGVLAHHFIVAITPLFIDYEGYKIGVLLLNLFFIFSVYFLTISLGDCLLKTSRRLSALAGTLILVLTSYFMETPHEFFFWLSGSCNYTIIVSFLSCSIGLFIRACCRKQGMIRWLYVFFTALLMWVIGTCNQSTALFAFILTVFATILIFVKSRNRFAKQAILLVLLFAAVGLGFNLFAPGNQARLSDSEQMAPLAAIWESLVNMLVKVFEWSQGVPLIVGLALFPLFFKATAKMNLKFSHPFIVLLFSFCIMATQFTPPLYAIQSIGPGRIADCVYYSYIWWLFGNLFYISGWLNHRLERKMGAKSKRVYALAVGILALCVIQPTTLKNANGVVCVSQFLNGEIQTYDREMTKIHNALEQAEEDTVTVTDLTVYPIVRAGSFSENSGSVINRTAAEYHGKKELIIEKAESD